MRKLFVIGIGTLVLGCSTRSSEPSQNRAAALTTTTGLRARTVMDGLRSFSSLSNRLGVGVRLSHDERGFRFDRSSHPAPIVAAGGSVLTGFAPLRANGAVHVARGDRPGVSLDIESALRDVVGEESEGAVVYADAALDQDVVQVLDGVRIEELRVLKSPRAANKFTWSLRPGPAVTSVRLRDGRIEILEGNEVRLISDPVVAFDAKDTRRGAQLALAKEGSYYLLEATLDTRELVYPVVLDPGWTRTFNKMAGIKLNTESVALSTGKVAVFPGQSSALTVDIYDPITDRFTSGPPTKSSRYYPGVWKLPGSDKVMYFGGSYGAATTFEIWDPITGSPSMDPLPTALDAPVYVTLATGKLFAINNGSTTAVIYDPSTTTWTTLPPMKVGNGNRAAVLLKSGKVLITGGCCNTAAAEIYDPTLNTFTTIASMQGARSGHSMTSLPSGNALVSGVDSSGSNAVELFDATTNTFSKLTGLPVTFNAAHRAIALPDGSVLLVNVTTTGEVVRYVEGTGFTKEATLTMRRDTTTVSLLPGGRVLAAGGEFGTVGVDSARDTAEVWTPASKTCTSATECTSGFCIDGHCCDRACTEQCYACDVSGREGFCSPVNGAPPHGTRTSCSPFLNCTNGACVSGCSTAGDCATGMGCIYGTCAFKLTNGTGCVSGTDCASGNCVDGRCCDSACTEQCKACDVSGSLGFCTNVTGAPHGARTSCAPYTCSVGSCLAGCTTDAQCNAGNRCDSTGTCVATLTNGKVCTRASECASGFCVDGYCCNSACDTACRTCAKTTALGTCSLVASGTTDPRSLCVGECVNGCGTTGCTFKAATTACGQSCIGNELVSGGRCSGTTEACTGASRLPCAGGLVCADGKTCKTSCVTGADCVSGYCEAGVCTSAPPDTGPPEEPTIEAGTDTAIDDTTVADTFVPDAFVPDTSVADTFVEDTSIADTTPPTIDALAESPAPTLDPTPKLPASVQTCTKSSDCPSGFCVEGVCCDSACTDRCHSCALMSNPGKCTIEPIGVDLKQECGPAYTCLGTCGGNGECIGSGTGTMCARNRCSGTSSGIGPAYCAGPGAKCAPDEGVAFDCSPYACAPAFGACLQSCATSKDCANGFVCDPGSKSCIALVAPEEDSGCAVSGVGRRGSYGIALFIAAFAIAARRRRLE
jgi:hypothetical protein